MASFAMYPTARFRYVAKNLRYDRRTITIIAAVDRGGFRYNEGDMTISLLLYPFVANNTFKLPKVLYYDGQNHHFDVIIPEKYELADAILPV